MRPYPLTPQVMNGTGALRQFVPRVARHQLPGDLWLLASASLCNDSRFAHHAASEKRHLRPFVLPF